MDWVTHPRITEREYTIRIVPCIEDYFRRRGFYVKWMSLSPKEESRFPTDEFFRVGNKIFGLQFKATKCDNRGIYWELNEKQHNLIQKNFKGIIYYALPKFYERLNQCTGLYHTIFVRPTIPYTPIIRMRNLIWKYTNWGYFAEGILSCRNGKFIQDIYDPIPIEKFFDLYEPMLASINLSEKELAIITKTEGVEQ